MSSANQSYNSYGVSGLFPISEEVSPIEEVAASEEVATTEKVVTTEEVVTAEEVATTEETLSKETLDEESSYEDKVKEDVLRMIAALITQKNALHQARETVLHLQSNAAAAEGRDDKNKNIRKAFNEVYQLRNLQTKFKEQNPWWCDSLKAFDWSVFKNDEEKAMMFEFMNLRGFVGAWETSTIPELEKELEDLHTPISRDYSRNPIPLTLKELEEMISALDSHQDAFDEKLRSFQDLQRSAATAKDEDEKKKRKEEAIKVIEQLKNLQAGFKERNEWWYKSDYYDWNSDCLKDEDGETARIGFHNRWREVASLTSRRIPELERALEKF